MNGAEAADEGDQAWVHTSFRADGYLFANMERCGPSMLDNVTDRTRAIVWRLRLSAPPERVFSAWLTPEDHVRFWSERSEDDPQGFRLQFIDGTVALCKVTERVSPSHIRIEYFGAQVDIALERLEAGTDLTLTARNVPSDEWQDVFAGWLNVLLPFKAWVDFGVDIRSHDPERTWREGYVDQ